MAIDAPFHTKRLAGALTLFNSIALPLFSKVQEGG